MNVVRWEGLVKAMTSTEVEVDIKISKLVAIKAVPFHQKDVDNLNKNEPNVKNLKRISNVKYKMKI